LERRGSLVDDSSMTTPLDPATLPRSATALRSVLLQREVDYAAALAQQAAELQAACTNAGERHRNRDIFLRPPSRKCGAIWVDLPRGGEPNILSAADYLPLVL
jgi:hypothetical protein